MIHGFGSGRKVRCHTTVRPAVEGHLSRRNPKAGLGPKNGYGVISNTVPARKTAAVGSCTVEITVGAEYEIAVRTQAVDSIVRKTKPKARPPARRQGRKEY